MKKYFLIPLAVVVFGFFFANTSSAATLPGVSTGGATWVFTTSVDFGITVTSLGGDPSVTLGVQYGTTTAYGSTVPGGTMTSPSSVRARSGLGSLVCNTIYHYRAYATNSAGTAYGSDATVTTNPCVTGTYPSVTTGSATVLSPTSVTLSGNITATGGSGLSVLQRGFQYNATGGTAYDSLVAGTFGTGPYSATLTGLSCGTTYTYRALTVNTVFFGSGAPLTFTTLPCPITIPTVITLAATGVTATVAYLNGRIVSCGGLPSCSLGFDFGTTTGYGTSIPVASLGSPIPWDFISGRSGLSCNTLYHYRAKATNSAGTGYGADVTFTTSPCPTSLPTVTTDPATAITATFAVLNGTLTSTGGSIPVSEGFNYGTTTAYGATYTVASATTLGTFSGGPSTPLSCNTLYHFRAWATNSVGTAYGIDRTFTTLPCPVALPTVTTDPATTITVSSGMIWGTITGGGTATSRGFEFGLTTSYTSTSTSTGTFGPGSFNANQMGLACNTLYHYRAYAANSAGTAYGIDRTFTTLPCPITIVPPTVITTTATAVGATAATLNGSITVTGGANATVVGFNWSTTTTVAGTGGAFVSTTVGGPFGVGPFSIPISGLTCGGVTYHYRAWATNSAGTSYGADMTFTTTPCPPVLPTVLTVAAASISTTSAVLNGNLTNLGGAVNVTGAFDYGMTTTYGASVTATSPIQPMTTTSVFNVNQSGLTCGTLYHFRAKATNSAGTSYGADMTFTTLPCPVTVTPPTVLTVAATSVTATSATLNGNLTSTGGTGISNSVDLLWDITTAIGFSNSASAGTRTTPGTFNASITGLTCNTAYHFFAQATNSAGTVYDAPLTFTTLPCPITVAVPSVSTTAASSIGVTSATMNGNLGSLGGAANATSAFEYGTTTSYGTSVTATAPSQPMTATGAFSKPLTGLLCNTLYHYRAKATNSAGTGYGLDRTFTTGICPVTITPPGVTTDPVSALTTVSATLNGTLTSLGGVPSATTSFEYGLTTSYGSTATFGSMTATGSFLKGITGLTCGTTYNFRAKATNTMGTVYGINRVFMTTGCPVAPVAPTVTTDPATAITATTATINGTVTATGGATVTATGFTGSFGSAVSTPTSITTVPTSFSHNLTGLSCGTNYTFRASATNSAGTGTGSLLNFTTTSCPPNVSTTSGLLITPYNPATGALGSANLIGNLSSFGLGNTNAVVGFEYGPTSSYGFSAVATGFGSSLGSFNANVPINLEFTCNDPWHFRATATNAGGTAFGVDKEFCNM